MFILFFLDSEIGRLESNDPKRSVSFGSSWEHNGAPLSVLKRI